MAAAEALQAGEAAELTGDFAVAAHQYALVLDDGDAHEAAEARFRLARIAFRQGQFDRALAEFERARAQAMSLDDAGLRARAENGVGAVHYARGEYALARSAYELAMQLSSDDNLRAKALLNLGVIATIEGRTADARAIYARSRALFVSTGDGRGEAMAMHNLGMLLADCSEFEAADECYRRCLQLAEAHGDRQLMAAVIVDRTELSCAAGRFEEGIAGCDVALLIASELGDEVTRAEALRWKGAALLPLGQLEAAAAALTEARKLASRFALQLLAAEVAREIARLREAEGDRAGALAEAIVAREGFVGLGASRDAAEAAALVERLQQQPFVR